MAALAAPAVACDQGPADHTPVQGPLLHLVATSPTAQSGLECTVDSPDDCGVPDDARIELRFDRYLDPTSVGAGAVDVYYSGVIDGSVTLLAHYDLIERVVVLSLPLGRRWTRGVRYGVEILLPEEPGDPGFRAIDGAPLDEAGSAPLEWSFRVRLGDADPAPDADPQPTCADVQALFNRAGCAGSICHQPVGSDGCPAGFAQTGADQPCVGVPRMGLDLSSADGLTATAIQQVAHQTETGSASGVPLQTPSRVGVQMPIIDPQLPSNSYLAYKLLRNPAIWDGVACETRYQVALAGQCPAPSPEERSRLREWFVRGQPMPPDGSGGLGRTDLDTLHAWLTQGAPRVGCE